MAENSQSAVTVAVIGLVGVLGAALIANWDKIGARNDRVLPAPTPAPVSVSAPPPVISIAGGWRDPNFPTNRSVITQDGSSFRFNGQGLFSGALFRITGTGTITGQNITTSYDTVVPATGGSSKGDCTGTVASDGRRMSLTCTDLVLGTYVSTSIRD